MKVKSKKSKVKSLKNILRTMKRILIAYSGGVDSTFLLKVAVDALGRDNVLAVTAKSETYTSSELKDAIKNARRIGARHVIISTHELKNPNFRKNPINRCYYCKSELFGRLKKIAKKENIRFVIDASNVDDLKDYRPGAKAKKELGVRSPLQEAGLTKNEIRQFSKRLGLLTWDKPAMACLASRVQYGQNIEQGILKRIEQAEDYLRLFGFRQVRVRCHKDIARIELLPIDIKRLNKSSIRGKITKRLKALGFLYITLDLEGYRTGSLNGNSAA